MKASNAKSKPEAIPEHNDPYRIDWTEVKGKNYIVGVDVSLSYPIEKLADRQALRIPDNSGYTVRYPILNRTLNRRDWSSSQQLLDDIEVILQEALKTELGISPRDYHVSRHFIQRRDWAHGRNTRSSSSYPTTTIVPTSRK